MRKIIFAILAMFCVAEASAQTPKYIPLVQCWNDPFLYIEANYVHNAQRVIGQTVQQFAQDLELSVEPSQIVVATHVVGEGNHPEWRGYYTGFSLYFYYEEFLYIIGVHLNPPYLYNEYSSPSIIQSDDTQWSTLYNYTFKTNTIQEIWVLKKKDGEWLDNYDRARDEFGLTGQALQDFLNQ